MKDNIADLQENLRNVEDKLSAAETCKTFIIIIIIIKNLRRFSLGSEQWRSDGSAGVRAAPPALARGGKGAKNAEIF